MKRDEVKKGSKERLKIQKEMSMFFSSEVENGSVIVPRCVKIQMDLESSAAQTVVILLTFIVESVLEDLESILEKRLRQGGSRAHTMRLYWKEIERK